MTDTLINIPGLSPSASPSWETRSSKPQARWASSTKRACITLNLGPQHPSTHGVFRMIMQLQGETIISAIPVMGYLHRSSEKLGEARTYVQGTVLTDQMGYLSPISTDLAYALSIERLTGLVVPERADICVSSPAN